MPFTGLKLIKPNTAFSGLTGIQNNSSTAFKGLTDTQDNKKEKKSLFGKVVSGVENFAKDLIRPVTTLAARPFQAAAELAGATSEDVNKYNLGGLVAPVPQNYKDVKKDIGRGLETVAFGIPIGKSTTLFGKTIPALSDVLAPGIGGKLIRDAGSLAPAAEDAVKGASRLERMRAGSIPLGNELFTGPSSVTADAINAAKRAGRIGDIGAGSVMGGMFGLGGAIASGNDLFSKNTALNTGIGAGLGFSLGAISPLVGKLFRKKGSKVAEDAAIASEAEVNKIIDNFDTNKSIPKEVPKEVPIQSNSVKLSLKNVEDVGKDSLVSDAKKAIAEGKSMSDTLTKEVNKFDTAEEFERAVGRIDISTLGQKIEIIKLFPKDVIRGKGIITKQVLYRIKKLVDKTGIKKFYASGISEDGMAFNNSFVKKGFLKNPVIGKSASGTNTFRAEITDKLLNEAPTINPLQDIFNKFKIPTSEIKTQIEIPKQNPEQVNTKQFTPKEVLKAKEDYKKQFNVDSQSVNPKLDKLTELDHQTNILQNLEMSRYKPKDVVRVGLNQMAPSELGSNLPATAFFRYSRTLVDEAANKGDVSLLDMWSKGDTETVKGKAGQSLQATGIASRDSSAVGVEEVKKLKFKKLPDYLQKNHDKSVLDIKDAINNLTDKLNKTPLDKATIYEIINKLKC